VLEICTDPTKISSRGVGGRDHTSQKKSKKKIFDFWTDHKMVPTSDF